MMKVEPEFEDMHLENKIIVICCSTDCMFNKDSRCTRKLEVLIHDDGTCGHRKIPRSKQ